MQRGDGWMSKRGFISVHEFNLSIQYIFLSGQRYALRTAEFSVYETISDTNTPVSCCRLTTVLDLHVSWTPWLSYTSEERHLLWRRPQSRDTDFLSCRRVGGQSVALKGFHSDSTSDHRSLTSAEGLCRLQRGGRTMRKHPYKAWGVHHLPRLNSSIFATFEICFQRFKTVYAEKHDDLTSCLI